MRKPLAAFCLVFALLAGFFGYTVVEALDAQDAVSFTVEQQLGDPAAAQGFQLNIPTFQNYDMAWDTTLTLGSTPTWSTDYRYDPGNISWYTPQESSPMLSIAVGDTSMFYISGDDWSTNVIGQAYREIIEDVSTRAPAKGSYSETVVLSDYLDYYPVILSDIPLPDSYSSGWETWDLTQALRIPVGQGDTIQVDLELDQNFVISSIYLSTPQAPSLYSEAILSNGYYYVLFSPEQQDFGLEFLGQTYHNRGMGQGGEREQAGIVGIVDHIHAVGIQCLFQLLDLASDHNGFQLAAQGVGQFAALGEQFQAHVSNAAFFGYFAIYKYVTHFFHF